MLRSGNDQNNGRSESKWKLSLNYSQVLQVVNTFRVGSTAKRVRRKTVRLQERLHTLCTDYKDGRVDMAAFLRGVGHTMRMRQTV